MNKKLYLLGCICMTTCMIFGIFLNDIDKLKFINSLGWFSSLCCLYGFYEELNNK